MATAFRSGSWSYEAVHTVTTLHRRNHVSCRASKQTTRENGSTPTVPFNVATSVAVSLAATTLFCSTDIALAARVQGGDFGDLDPFSSAKTGVQVAEPKLKSPFGPAPPPEKEAPKVAEPLPPPVAASKKIVKKQQAPAKKPVAKSQPAKPVQKAQPVQPPSKPSLSDLLEERRKEQAAQKIVKKQQAPSKKPVAKSQPAKPIQKAQPVQPPSKPSLGDLLKERRKEPSVQKIVPPTKPAAAPIKGISTPSVSLPTLSTSSKDATEAGIVVGIEILLALIASSTVSGLLKKA